jgi:hypothetical protein
MSCAVRSIGTISPCALAFVLALAAAPPPALPQTPVCHPIRGGESATRVARRITGDGRNRYQPWFQIMDRSSKFVPKSQYDRIRAGWRACIVKEVIDSSVRVTPASQRETLEAPDVLAGRPQPAAANTVRPIGGIGLTPEWAANTLRPISGLNLMVVWLAAAVIVPLFGWRLLDNYVSRRNTKAIVMKHFAYRFVSEFERPLIQEPAGRPVRSRLRLSPARARIDILLAPGEGRRYPNLSDHKQNLEYDVVRILRVLSDDSFVRDPLYMQAGWVVVPFRFKVGRKHIGVA